MNIPRFTASSCIEESIPSFYARVNVSNSNNQSLNNQTISTAAPRCPRCSPLCDGPEPDGRCYKECCDANGDTYYLECRCPAICKEECTTCITGTQLCTRRDCTSYVRICDPVPPVCEPSCWCDPFFHYINCTNRNCQLTVDGPC
jgi:hypothetical protein